MQRLGIPFVAKEENPPNAPQIRPIENWWGILKQEVYRGDWSAKSEEMLVRRVRYAARKIQKNDPEIFQSLFGSLKTKMRKAADNGLSSLI